MKNKSFSAILFIAILLCGKTSFAKKETVWTYSPVGKCFASTQAFLDIYYGDYAKDNELVKVRAVLLDELIDRRSTIYFWVYDDTVDINQTQTLLKKTRNGTYCAILYVPYTTLNKIFLSKPSGLPATVSSIETASNGWVTSIVQTLSPITGTYHPSRCSMDLLGTARKKPIKCADVFK